MLRRSSHWPAKLAVKRRALRIVQQPLDLGPQDGGLASARPWPPARRSSPSGMDDQRKYDSREAMA